MKRNLIRFIYPLLVLCSCTEADNSLWQKGTPDAGEAIPVTVRSVGRVEAQAVTRGAVSKGEIGLFLTGTDNGVGKYSDRNNCKYTNSGSGWAAANEANTVSLFRLKANVWAYHPYHMNTENGKSYIDRTAIPLQSQAYSEQEDICYGAGTVSGNVKELTSSNAAGGISFTDMEHVYALVSFSFSLNEYTGAGKITKIKLENVIANTTMNITTGEYAQTESNTDSSVEEVVDITVPPNSSISSLATENMLMIPCTFNNLTGSITGVDNCGLKVVLTLDGKELSVGIHTGALPKLEAGKKYVISITLQGAPAATFGESAVETVEWTNNEIDGGNL